MDIEVVAEVEIDIVEEANSRGISSRGIAIQKILKWLYEESNLAIGLLGEEFGNFNYYALYGTPKMKKMVPKLKLGPKEPLEVKIMPAGWAILHLQVQ